MRKIVGKVTEEEKSVIKGINAHKNSLEELLLSLPEDDELYKIALNDMAETTKKYKEWWNRHYEKYHWEKGEDDWTILFDTNEIIIEPN